MDQENGGINVCMKPIICPFKLLLKITAYAMTLSLVLAQFLPNPVSGGKIFLLLFF